MSTNNRRTHPSVFRIKELPTELLTHILEFGSSETVPYACSGQAEVWLGYGYKLSNQVKYSHVCHQWRELVTTSPRFWRELLVDFTDQSVSTGMILDHLRTLLPRSPSWILRWRERGHISPPDPDLDLDEEEEMEDEPPPWQAPDPTVVQAAVAAVSEHAASIIALDVHYMTDDNETPPLLSLQYPAVRALTFLNEVAWNRFAFPTAARFPVLQCLGLSISAPRADVILPPSLTQLRIHRELWPAQVAFLRATAGIRVLHLDDFAHDEDAESRAWSVAPRLLQQIRVNKIERGFVEVMGGFEIPVRAFRIFVLPGTGTRIGRLREDLESVGICLDFPHGLATCAVRPLVQVQPTPIAQLVQRTNPPAVFEIVVHGEDMYDDYRVDDDAEEYMVGDDHRLLAPQHLYRDGDTLKLTRLHVPSSLLRTLICIAPTWKDVAELQIDVDDAVAWVTESQPPQLLVPALQTLRIDAHAGVQVELASLLDLVMRVLVYDHLDYLDLDGVGIEGLAESVRRAVGRKVEIVRTGLHAS